MVMLNAGSQRIGDGRGGMAQLQLLHPPQEWKENQLQRLYVCRLAQNGGAKRKVSVNGGLAGLSFSCCIPHKN